MTRSEEQSRPLLIEHEKGYMQEEDHSHEWTQRPSAAMRRRILLRLAALVTPAHILTFLKRLGYIFVPQLLRSRIWNDPAPKSKEFSTAYLNGLRGIAAVKVFTFHYTFVYSDFGFQPYGVNARHLYFLELPIIRYFYSGFTSHVFFGIAGYLTSLRLFQLLDKNDAPSQAKVLNNISGSLFRRAFRLYVPVFLITLITATYIHVGFYESNRAILLDHVNLFPGDWNETKPPQFPTYAGQLRFWASEMFRLTNVVSEKVVYPWHDQHLWSILAEMRASLHLYGCLVALAQCKRHVRLILLVLLALLYFYWNHWEVWVYILGAAVAQLDLILTDRDRAAKVRSSDLPIKREKDDEDNKAGRGTNSGLLQIRLRTWAKPILRVLAYLVAFYLLSYPIDGSRDYAPGYMTLNLAIPKWMKRKDKFYPNVGTAMLLLLLARSDPAKSRWRKICMHGIPQYLGKISFSLYLVHGPLMHAFGYLVPHRIWWTFGVEGKHIGNVPWVITIMIGWAVTLIVSLWAADCWTREVEGRCVKFVKWLEAACFLSN